MKAQLCNDCNLAQAEHLQVLLDAPGIRPMALCLFRQGDVDWLSLYEMHKVLPVYIPRGFINKGIPTGDNLNWILSLLS